MERDFKTLGIVLKKDNVRDNDVVLTLLTPDRGMEEVYVYGVRKSAKAVRASLFTEGVFSLSRRTEKGKAYMKDIDVLSYHEKIAESLEKTAWASLFCEMVIKGKTSDASLYNLFVEVIDNLESGNVDKCAIFFLVKYFKYSGMGGDWRTCPKCLREYEDHEVLGFALSLGAAVCSKCDEIDGNLIVPPNARKYLARIYECQIKEALEIKISEEMTRRISRNLLRSLRHSFPAILKVLDAGLIV